MNTRLTILALVAATLAAALVVDRRTSDAPLPPPPRTEAAADGAGEQALNPLSAIPEAAVADLFERPLFSPSRRKAEAAAPAAAVPAAPVLEVVAPAASEAPAEALPMLLGTVTSPTPGGVFVGDDAGGAVDFLRPGDTSRGLTLQSLTVDSATFQGPDGPVVLHLPRPGDGEAAASN